MSEEDKELEQLKKKRLAEMEKNIAIKQKQEEVPPEQKQDTPREILLKRLGYRGLEVLENAESQYPSETKIVVEKLSELLASGEINEEIDGGKLLVLFRSVGLNVRMENKINVEQDGKFVSLSDKLSSKTSSFNTQNSTNDGSDSQ
ncbi:MAG: double-stranded DNA-binding protein [Nitrososphaeria archaeon]|nr:double-stranded DNA-binding protein [Nitrosopumilaceae archaeon]NIP09762.1 double-stranded DNA-binding protein [Nitrosopumilaceae archaeon]NIP91309.1 double-stranded DNA-binding protein [Nitrososphaeria archaeon]NIS95821.1 double-stranded DNA-binding protein [Nitrosopumilaceae archaeon]